MAVAHPVVEAFHTLLPCLSSCVSHDMSNYWVWFSTSHYATYPNHWYGSINCRNIASTRSSSSIVSPKHFETLPYTLPGIPYTGSICVRVFHHCCRRVLFLPADIQHAQRPCRFFLLEIQRTSSVVLKQ